MVRVAIGTRLAVAMLFQTRITSEGLEIDYLLQMLCTCVGPQYYRIYSSMACLYSANGANKTAET